MGRLFFVPRKNLIERLKVQEPDEESDDENQEKHRQAVEYNPTQVVQSLGHF